MTLHSSQRPQDLQDLIHTVQDWCAENFFRVGLRKSGILTIGPANSDEDIHRYHFKVHGRTLRRLNFEKSFSSITYLGFKISPTGDWSEFLTYLAQKTGWALSENFDALGRTFQKYLHD